MPRNRRLQTASKPLPLLACPSQGRRPWFGGVALPIVVVTNPGLLSEALAFSSVSSARRRCSQEEKGALHLQPASTAAAEEEHSAMTEVIKLSGAGSTLGASWVSRAMLHKRYKRSAVIRKRDYETRKCRACRPRPLHQKRPALAVPHRDNGAIGVRRLSTTTGRLHLWQILKEDTCNVGPA